MLFMTDGNLFNNNIYDRLCPDNIDLFISNFDVIFECINNKTYEITCTNPDIYHDDGYIVNPLNEKKIYSIQFISSSPSLTLTFNNTFNDNMNYVSEILDLEEVDVGNIDDIIDKNKVLLIMCEYYRGKDINEVMEDLSNLEKTRQIKYS